MQKDFHYPSKREGSGHWLMQRLTGVLLIGFSLWFFWSLLNHITADYGQALLWVREPLNAVGFSILMALLLHHMVLGVEVVIDDYVHVAFWHSVALFCLKAFQAINIALIVFSFYQIFF